ncbi:hypothetical protein MNEG_4697 [Monoraphidium neglectum]|uniref:Uncharacterized protein n=1 Tax=Monoraphidium neglectum TaxID=145388 RepID=A0A0D2MS84_9CHLO|nr:hypothetical protein MNEG_4697 [Monoraphidium neglectum]KIZ03257.1 hypothetical protein MNEG_4697 [Monoraphidium neglectum]|eukprot:XP_013902276.1 hypothetical protein MNEG_4697 [Monoraphidium neglectum]
MGVARERLLPIDCCATAVAFHPTEPALLAGGTFNGEVVLWDLGRDAAAGDDPQVARTDSLGEARHREPVTALAWQYSAAEARRHGAGGGGAHLLLSLGADGRLLVWRGAGGRLDNPLMTYELRCPQPGSGFGAGVLPGALCMSIPRGRPRSSAPAAPAAPPPAPGAASEAAGAAFVGLEGGRLLRCQLADADEAALREQARALAGGERQEPRCPVREAGYERHEGAVTGVAASPFQAHAVLSCGTDGCVQLFNSMRLRPALRLYAPAAPLLGVAWSPVRPLVFAASTGDGTVLFYDLGRAQQQGALPAPALALDARDGGGGGGRPRRRAAAAFNRAVPALFATAAGGEVKVWRLPEQLAGGGDQLQASKQLARLVQLG